MGKWRPIRKERVPSFQRQRLAGCAANEFCDDAAGRRLAVCTYHQSRLKKGMRHGAVPRRLVDELIAAFDTLDQKGIEPTLPLPVITGEREVVTMSWGFRRTFRRKDGKGKTAAKPVVNAKCEKMMEFMWRDAFLHRRCIIPVTDFYEWTYPGGVMKAHRFHRGGELFFVAGLWEESPDFGFCHTMLTTEPNAEVAATGHDRCLVALLDHEVDPWLDGKVVTDFHRPDGLFQVESDVPNPRGKTGPSLLEPIPKPPVQGELF